MLEKVNEKRGAHCFMFDPFPSEGCPEWTPIRLTEKKSLEAPERLVVRFVDVLFGKLQTTTFTMILGEE
jgi:hypothetical protein